MTKAKTKSKVNIPELDLSLIIEKDYFVPGHQFFIEKLDGMTNPSIGYCSHYGKFEVFVVDVINSNSQDEKILVEIIGNVNDKIYSTKIKKEAIINSQTPKYSGLKDMDGNEIFEGHILNGEIVRFSDGCFFLGNNPLALSHSHRKIEGEI